MAQTHTNVPSDLVAEIDYSKDALKNIGSAPHLALKPYAQLRNIALSLKDAQPRAEGAAPHLVDYIERLASALREQMKRDFSGRLQKKLEQMKWPSKDLRLPDDLMTQWRSDVELLLDLQIPYGLPSLLSSAPCLRLYQGASWTRRLLCFPECRTADIVPGRGDGPSAGASIQIPLQRRQANK